MRARTPLHLAPSMEWVEMIARTIYFHAMDTWTVDVEWIASLRHIICHRSIYTHTITVKWGNKKTQILLSFKLRH
jgi:hypothetical protein